MNFKKTVFALTALIALNNFTPALGNKGKDFYSSKVTVITQKIAFGAGAAFCSIISLLGFGTALGILNTDTEKKQKKVGQTMIGLTFGLAALYLGRKALSRQSLKKSLTNKTAKTS